MARPEEKSGVQFFWAPDGTEMAIIPRDRWEALCRLAEYADANLSRSEFVIPEEVAVYIRSGLTPVAAWRKVAGLTQAGLAAKAGVTQAAIARIEVGPPGSGRNETLKAIAKALNAPLAHINPPPLNAAQKLHQAIALSSGPSARHSRMPDDSDLA